MNLLQKPNSDKNDEGANLPLEDLKTTDDDNPDSYRDKS
jgi:hypothetical protein